MRTSRKGVEEKYGEPIDDEREQEDGGEEMQLMDEGKEALNDAELGEEEDEENEEEYIE